MIFHKLFVFILAFCIYGCTSRHFRFDYEYYPDIDGWLKLHLIPVPMSEAYLRCDLEGAILASPTDPKMLLAMNSHWNAKKRDECGFYTGVNAFFAKTNFFSIEGVPLAKMPVQWASGEPDNANNSEDCIILTNGTIADVNCTELFPYMCFKKKTKNTVMTSCGTVDKDYEMDPQTRNCYKFHRIGADWFRAAATCAAEGGHLAIINSLDEAHKLRNIYVRHYNVSGFAPGVNKDVILIGNYKWMNTDWKTIHGMTLEDAGYAKWNQGQPDNSSPGQSCGAMFQNLKLDDFWCSGVIAPFICEKSPDSLLNDNVY